MNTCHITSPIVVVHNMIMELAKLPIKAYSDCAIKTNKKNHLKVVLVFVDGLWQNRLDPRIPDSISRLFFKEQLTSLSWHLVQTIAS